MEKNWKMKSSYQAELTEFMLLVYLQFIKRKARKNIYWTGKSIVLQIPVKNA